MLPAVSILPWRESRRRRAIAQGRYNCYPIIMTAPCSAQAVSIFWRIRPLAMRTREGLLVEQQSNIIRPQPRRQSAKSAGPTDLTGVHRRTRVLIRLPAITVGEALAAPRSTDTTNKLASGSASSDANSAVRIDASHIVLPPPHVIAPDWLTQPSGTLSRILERRSLLAMTLIAAGVV